MVLIQSFSCARETCTVFSTVASSNDFGNGPSLWDPWVARLSRKNCSSFTYHIRNKNSNPNCIQATRESTEDMRDHAISVNPNMQATQNPHTLNAPPIIQHESTVIQIQRVHRGLLNLQVLSVFPVRLMYRVAEADPSSNFNFNPMQHLKYTWLLRIREEYLIASRLGSQLRIPT